MTIPCNYWINVATAPTNDAKYGRFYCRIELGDILSEKATERFEEIKSFFPDDWILELERTECYSYKVKKEQ